MVLDCGWYVFDVRPPWPDTMRTGGGGFGQDLTIVGKLYWTTPFVAAVQNPEWEIATVRSAGQEVAGKFSIEDYKIVDHAFPVQE